MSKIKLTESQIKMIQEYEKSLGKKKVLKITKEHYDALFSNINESSEVTKNFKKYGKDLGVKYESHPAEGSYIPQSEKENEKTHASFNESISEDISSILDLSSFTAEFIAAVKQFIADPSQEGLSPFWIKMGVTWGDLKGLMLYFGIMTTTVMGGNEVLVRVKAKDKVLKGIKFLGRHLWNMMAKKKRYDMSNKGAVIQDEGLSERDGDYPLGADNDPRAPWNQEDSDERVENETGYDLITYNDNIAILKRFKNKMFYLLNIDNEIIDDDDDLYRLMNHLDNSDLLNSELQPLDLDLINNIENSFELNSYFKGKLEKIKSILMSDTGMEENTTTASVGGSYVTPKIWAKSKSDMKFGKDPMIKGGKMLNDPLVEDKFSKTRYVVELDMYIFADNDKEAMVIGNQIEKIINKKFDASARVTNVVPKKFGQIGENIDERTGQVSFDDCVKLDNNKVAQNGGCSVGAVDNVVKVDETVLESVAKQTGKTISEVREIILKHKTKNNGK